MNSILCCKLRDSHAPFFPFAVAKVLQKTNTNQIFPQLFFNFFPEKSPKHHISAFYSTIFYALQHIFPSPSLKQSHTDIIRPISHHLLHCKNKKAPTLKMSRLFLLYIIMSLPSIFQNPQIPTYFEKKHTSKPFIIQKFCLILRPVLD